jgi:hypothetical protein
MGWSNTRESALKVETILCLRKTALPNSNSKKLRQAMNYPSSSSLSDPYPFSMAFKEEEDSTRVLSSPFTLLLLLLLLLLFVFHACTVALLIEEDDTTVCGNVTLALQLPLVLYHEEESTDPTRNRGRICFGGVAEKIDDFLTVANLSRCFCLPLPKMVCSD